MIAFLKCSFTCQYFWARLLLRTWISEIIVEKDICGYFFCCIDRTNETEFELVQRQWLGLVKRLAIRDSMMKNDQNKWLESREGDSSHLFTMPGTIVWAAGLVIYKKKKKKKKKKPLSENADGQLTFRPEEKKSTTEGPKKWCYDGFYFLISKIFHSFLLGRTGTRKLNLQSRFRAEGSDSDF